MSITGKFLNGVMYITVKGILYPVIKSNYTAVEAYWHTGDESYLLALATEKELARYGN